MPSGAKKTVYAALIGNLLIAATKGGAAALTGSSAMFSEAVHSVVDTGNEMLLLYGMRRAALPADTRFPFGHGKEIYFWSFVVALLVFSLGAGISFYEGVQHIRHPVQVADAYINYIVLGLALLFEGASWLVALGEFRARKGERGYLEAVHASKDPTIFTVLFEDSAALLGLLAAGAGLLLSELTGNPVYDGIASLVIGAILSVAAIWLAYETKSLLIGESAGRDVVDGIRTMIADVPEVDRVNEILTMHVGPDFILVNISLHVADAIDRAQVVNIYTEIDREIKRRFPKVKRVFIETELAITPAVAAPDDRA